MEICPQVLWRITPAYAGNTSKKPLKDSQYKDHPRIRGEHKQNCDITGTQSGSPPHTRGTLHSTNSRHFLTGITPAYAGNTNKIPQEFRTPLGSPPHTRGTQRTLAALELISGITPAYAGNTGNSRRRIARYRDHPRIRGEHSDKN